MEGKREFSRWRPHPWHGIDPCLSDAGTLQVYIEITPFDLAKYEIDPRTGYLRIDRPQHGSSLPPMLYGFIPRTLCAGRVAGLGPGGHEGDGDALDACVVCEVPVGRSEVLLEVRVVGGFLTLDNGKTDDKIITVYVNDLVFGQVKDIDGLPESLLQRVRHYFATYKMIPGQPPRVTVEELYHRGHALEVVSAAMEDYRAEFGSAGEDAQELAKARPEH